MDARRSRAGLFGRWPGLSPGETSGGCAKRPPCTNTAVHAFWRAGGCAKCLSDEWPPRLCATISGFEYLENSLAVIACSGIVCRCDADTPHRVDVSQPHAGLLSRRDEDRFRFDAIRCRRNLDGSCGRLRSRATDVSGRAPYSKSPVVARRPRYSVQREEGGLVRSVPDHSSYGFCPPPDAGSGGRN